MNISYNASYNFTVTPDNIWLKGLLANSDSSPIRYVYLSLIAGSIIFYKGLRWFSLRRMIEDLPTSKIRAIAMGIAEVAGTMKQHEENILASPITGQKCIYYFYSIEGYVYNPERNSKEWIVVATGTKMAPYFKVRDDTGEVLVSTEGSKGLNRTRVIVGSDYTEGLDAERIRSIISDENEVPGIIRKLLPGFSSAERFRYHEIAVKPGDNIYVMGYAGKNPFAQSGTAQKSEDAIMIQKGKYNDLFYISEKQERDVTKKLKRDSMLGISIGALIMTVSLTIILIYFNLI